MHRAFDSDLSLRVEISGGAHIEAVCDQLVTLAQRLGIWVEADFNGVTLLACPRTSRAGLAESWRRRIDDESRYKIASAH